MIFDLDETLIHCDKKSVLPGGIKLTVDIDGIFGEVSIFIRPHIKECLKKLKEHYEIVLFTAGFQGYADAIIDYIDPKGKIFDYRLYRQHCLSYCNDAVMLKDLRIIKNRNLKDVVLVDNSAISFLTQIDNGIPILSYYDKKDDNEFLELTQYLLSIKDKHDLRETNK